MQEKIVWHALHTGDKKDWYKKVHRVTPIPQLGIAPPNDHLLLLDAPPFCRCEEDSGELGNCLSFFGLFTIVICFISVAILCLTKPMSSSAHWHKVDLILFITVIDIYLAHSLLLKKNGNGKSRNKKNAEHITVLGEYLQIISHITVPCAQEHILGAIVQVKMANESRCSKVYKVLEERKQEYCLLPKSRLMVPPKASWPWKKNWGPRGRSMGAP